MMSGQDAPVSGSKTRLARSLRPRGNKIREDPLEHKTVRLQARHTERASSDSNSDTPVLQVKPVGRSRGQEDLSVISVTKKTSPVVRGLRFSVPQRLSGKSPEKNTSECSNSAERKKLSDKTATGEQDSQTLKKQEELFAVVGSKNLNTSLSSSKMKKASLTQQKVACVSQRQSRNSKSRSGSPLKKSDCGYPKNRSPRKNTNQETPPKSSIPFTSEMPNKHILEKSVESSPKKLSPRSKMKQSQGSGVYLKSEPVKPKELSPRELDAIRTLRKLKSRSPQKKAITNEMRKSACHTKQNERKDSLIGQQKPADNRNLIAIPRITVTDPKGEKMNESPERASGSVTSTVIEQDTPKAIKSEKDIPKAIKSEKDTQKAIKSEKDTPKAIKSEKDTQKAIKSEKKFKKAIKSEKKIQKAIKSEIQSSPKKRYRKKKRSVSSPVGDDLHFDPDYVYEIHDSLKIEPSRSTRRVRSPSARYKEDIIMYPWYSPKKKQSPKKSPVDKSKEDQNSGLEDSTSENSSNSDESSESSSEYDSPQNINCNDSKQAQSLSRDKILCAARVLNFDEIDVSEYSKIGDKPPTVDSYRSLLHTSQGNHSTDLIGLTGLIAKVNGSIAKTNEGLIYLFGTAAEPNYCDDNVNYKGDDDEGPSESQDTVESLQGNTDIAKENVSASFEEKETKPKNDSDLDSTIEYTQGTSPKEKENEYMDGDLSFAGEIKKDSDISQGQNEAKMMVNVDLEAHKDESKTTIPSVKQLQETELSNQILDEEKPRNVFDLFGDKQKVDCTNDIKNASEESKCSGDGENKPSEIDIEKPVPGILADNDMSSESSISLSKMEKTQQTSAKVVDSDIQETEESVSLTGLKQDSKPLLTNSDNHDFQNNKIDSESCAKDEDAVILVLDNKESGNNEVALLSDEGVGKENKISGNKTDRRGFEQLRSSPRCVPRFSTVCKTILEPSSLAVLKLIEKETTNKHCAFVSHELEDYLKPYVPAENTEEDSASTVMKATTPKMENNLPNIESANKVKQELALTQGVSDECVDDTDQMQNPRPDLDEVGDILFISFSSEEAMLAHIELERKHDWLDEINLKRMKHLMNKEKENEHDTTTPSKSPSAKHNLRGIPGRITKYCKLLKQEYDIILKAKENRVPVNLRTKTPEKTADITKIKGWKNKYANTEELQQATGLHFSEAGKLHWRTEERIMKQLEPKDVKEIGLDLKKKRRKLVHYTKRKGESKAEKPKHSETADDGEEMIPLVPLENNEILDDENSREPLEKLPYHVRFFSQHKYGKRKLFVKRMKMDTADENILKKLGSQYLAEKEQKKKEKDSENKTRKSKELTYVIKLSHSMALAAISALDKKLIAKAKGIENQNTKNRLSKRKVNHVKAKKPEETNNNGVHEKKCKQESDSESEGDVSDGYEEIPEDEIKREISKNNKHKREMSEKGDNGSPTSSGKVDDSQAKKKSSPSKSCDQPGCRYGCICHLYNFSEKEDKEDSDHKPPCDKEYCRLGCICDSISTKTEDQSHCGNPDCMFECKSKPKTQKKEAGNQGKQESQTGNQSKQDREPADINKERRKSDDGQHKTRQSKRKKRSSSRKKSDDQDFVPFSSMTDEPNEDSSDWEPPPKKCRDVTRPKAAELYASLPKRETKHRLAKNLDAVTRKAKQVYESSEMYVEQKVKRRKSDPVPELVSEGDYLDYLPPDWRDSFEPSSSTAEQPPGLKEDRQEEQPKPMDISTEDVDKGPMSCARTKGYDGQRKSNKPAVILVEESPEKVERKTKKKNNTVLVDLVDSDCEVTEVRQQKAENKPREMTASEKLGMVKKKPQDKIGESDRDKPLPNPGLEKIWKTQMVCLKAKKKALAGQPNEEPEIKLLEIISNCNWEPDRANLLSKISHIISKDYPKDHVMLWSTYAMQFLPKADKPAIIPPELKTKLPESMFSIRIRVTKNLKDIEQAENGSTKDKDTDIAGTSLQDEGVQLLSDNEKKQYESLRLQKKLIDKIRFAEKLKDLIEQEEKKGPQPSKFSISKDGIEKALKRYKTQLWKAYTGHCNMSLPELREAVLKAKSSNYTEKINQAISAIEKKAERVTTDQSDPSESNQTMPGTSSSGCVSAQESITVPGTSSSRFVFAQGSATVPGTSNSGSVLVQESLTAAASDTSASKTISDTTMVKPGSEFKTLSSSAKARIEANQGIVISSNAHHAPVSKNPETRVTAPGGKQPDFYLFPLTTGEGSTTPSTLPRNLNMVPVEGSSSFINLQPVSVSSATGPTVVSNFTASAPVTTCASESVVLNATVPTSGTPISSPGLVKLMPLDTSKVSSIKLPIPGAAGASSTSTPLRMPVKVVVDGPAESVRPASPVVSNCSSGTQPVLFSGQIKLNGQTVWAAVQKSTMPQSSQASSSVNTTAISSVPQTVWQESVNTVSLLSGTSGKFSNISQYPTQMLVPKSVSGIQTPVTISSSVVNGPQVCSVASSVYPSVNPKSFPNQFKPVLNASYQGPVGVRTPPPTSLSGAHQMVPMQMLNHQTNTSSSVVQLIPVSSTSLINSGSNTLKSVAGNQTGFIAVPIHFSKPVSTQDGSVEISQTLLSNVTSPSSGIKFLPPGALISTGNPPVGFRAVSPLIQKPASPATSLVATSAETKAKEGDVKLISILPKPVNTNENLFGEFTETESSTDTVNNEVHTTVSNLAESESKCRKKKKNKKRSSDKCLDLESIKEKSEAKKRKKSYAEKLDDLNKLDGTEVSSKSAVVDNKVSENCTTETENLPIEPCQKSNTSVQDDRNPSSENKIEESLRSDKINLSKTDEDAPPFTNEMSGDQCKDKEDVTSKPQSQKITDIDSVDGDTNFDNSPSVLSEAGNFSSPNISTLIKNTNNAGLQIASVLGNALDSPDLANTEKKQFEAKSVNLGENTEVISEDESIPKVCTVNSDNDSQDSDGCLIIDENYISPCKRKQNVAHGENKKLKADETQEDCETNQKWYDTGSETKEEKDGDPVQLIIEDSEDDLDVEIIAESHTELLDQSTAQELRKPHKPQVDPENIESSARLKLLAKFRRHEIKKKFMKLAKLVVMYNREVKQTFLKSAFSSTVQMPKHLVLDGARRVIEKFQEEAQYLEELHADGKQYHESLKKKLETLKDSFITSGVPDIVVNNFLKGVASSARLMEKAEGSSSVAPDSKGQGIVDLTRDVTNETEPISIVCTNSESSSAPGTVRIRAMKSLLNSSHAAALKVCVVKPNMANAKVDSDSVVTAQSWQGNCGKESADSVPDTGSCHGNNVNTLSGSVTSHETNIQTDVNNKDNIPHSTVDLSKDSNLHTAETACDNQTKCDSQSSATKTNLSNETSSQTSSQSDNIVLVDSAILETSAAKINQSELVILGDSEGEDKGEIHHLDDILNEWSAEICGQ